MVIQDLSRIKAFVAFVHTGPQLNKSVVAFGQSGLQLKIGIAFCR